MRVEFSTLNDAILFFVQAHAGDFHLCHYHFIHFHLKYYQNHHMFLQEKEVRDVLDTNVMVNHHFWTQVDLEEQDLKQLMYKKFLNHSP